MIEDFFIDKCDIYHLNSNEAVMKFGLPSGMEFKYSERPNISKQPCKFHVVNENIKQEQGSPDNKLIITRKLSYPADVDINVNDKIVDCRTGFEYTALQPNNIRGHHNTVTLVRKQTQAII